MPAPSYRSAANTCSRTCRVLSGQMDNIRPLRQCARELHPRATAATTRSMAWPARTSMAGGHGSDVYLVDSSFDQIVENANEGDRRGLHDGELPARRQCRVPVHAGNREHQRLRQCARATTSSAIPATTRIDGGVGADTMVGGTGQRRLFRRFELRRDRRERQRGHRRGLCERELPAGRQPRESVPEGSRGRRLRQQSANFIQGNSGNNGIDGDGGATCCRATAATICSSFNAGEATATPSRTSTARRRLGRLDQVRRLRTAAQGATFTQLNATQWQDRLRARRRTTRSSPSATAQRSMRATTRSCS